MTPLVENQTENRKRIYIPNMGQTITFITNNLTFASSLNKLFSKLSRVTLPKGLPEVERVIKYIKSYVEVYRLHTNQIITDKDVQTLNEVGRTSAESVKEQYDMVKMNAEQLSALNKFEKEFGGTILNKFGRVALYDHETKKSKIFVK